MALLGQGPGCGPRPISHTLGKHCHIPTFGPEYVSFQE